MSKPLIAIAAAAWVAALAVSYHVFIDHALSVMYVCAGPEHHLPDPGPPSWHHPEPPRSP
jgi:hypothetical protein